MSRWSRVGWYESAPKQEPPERGIRVKKAGTTWWGQRWIAALEEVLRGDSARLARGRSYARAGRTHDLVVRGGKVTARVTGTRPSPYKVTIELCQLAEAAWAEALGVMAKKAQFSAELLAGQMPQQIDEAFREAGVSLFPRQRSELKTSCSCPDWGDPCKHVAATHFVLGEALDRDPYLIFELRGRTKERVLEALRAARAGNETSEASEATKSTKAPKKKRSKAEAAPASEPLDAPTVQLGELSAADYDRPREPLPPLRFDFDEPSAHGAVLRQLGAPAAWQSDASPAELFAPVVRAAAEAARRIAMAEPVACTSGAPPAQGAPPAPPTRARAPRKSAAKRQVAE